MPSSESSILGQFFLLTSQVPTPLLRHNSVFEKLCATVIQYRQKKIDLVALKAVQKDFTYAVEDQERRQRYMRQEARNNLAIHIGKVLEKYTNQVIAAIEFTIQDEIQVSQVYCQCSTNSY